MSITSRFIQKEGLKFCLVAKHYKPCRPTTTDTYICHEENTFLAVSWRIRECLPFLLKALAKSPFCTALEMAVSAAEVCEEAVCTLIWACAPLPEAWNRRRPAVDRGVTEKAGEGADVDKFYSNSKL